MQFHMKYCFLLILILICKGQLLAQDSVTIIGYSQLVDIEKMGVTAKAMVRDIEKVQKRYLKKIQKIENKLLNKLYKIDSSGAQVLKESNRVFFGSIESSIKKASNANYFGRLDTLITGLDFLQKHSSGLSQASNSIKALSNSTKSLNEFKQKLQEGRELSALLEERKAFLKETLKGINVSKYFKGYSKELYYLNSSIIEIKQVFREPRKAEERILFLLNQTSQFKEFLREHSELATLFRIPNDPSDPSGLSGLAGLQTRSQVAALIQQQIGPVDFQSVRQNLNEAQGQLELLKSKLSKNPDATDDLPDFKPNHQKSKNFWRRVEIGSNVQSNRGNSFFPVTSDVGLSAGYKLNDVSVVGIGSSFKLGWGEGVRNIRFSSQGVALRSFLDIKLKGGFWATGGFELNYWNRINSLSVFSNLNPWQKSGLIGVSKIVSMNSKFFKKTKVQILWDFIGKSSSPNYQPFMFRYSYNFR